MAEPTNTPAEEEIATLPKTDQPQKPEKAAPAPGEGVFIDEPKQNIDMETFWKGIDAQTSVVITGPIYAPANYNEVGTISGSIVFKEFPDSARSFSAQVKRIHNAAEKPDTPAVALILSAAGIMEAVAYTVHKFAIRDQEKMSNSLRMAGEFLPVIFTHVFKAIKGKSEGLLWTNGPEKLNGSPIPLVEIIYPSGTGSMLGPAAGNLQHQFEENLTKIKAAAEEILPGGEMKEKKGPSFAMKRRQLVRKLLTQIPEESFKSNGLEMVVTLPLEEVEKIGGKEVAEAIRATTPVGTEGVCDNSDADTFWYRYFPNQDVVVLENKRLTDKMYLERIQKIWGKYPGDNFAAVGKSIAVDLGIPVETITEWFSNLIKKLTPGKQEKVREILDLPEEKEEEKPAEKPTAKQGDAERERAFKEIKTTLAERHLTDAWFARYKVTDLSSLIKGLQTFREEVESGRFGRPLSPDEILLLEYLEKTAAEAEQRAQALDKAEGIKKVAYPDVVWAGPALSQVGALIGTAEATWASELAGALAAKFDYISFPKLEGNPSDLRKLAALPLTPSQVERVSKYRDHSVSLMMTLVSSLFNNLEEVPPPKEEVERLAEDVLINLVESTPSSMSDEEFKSELNDKVRVLTRLIQEHPHGAFPSTKSDPGDVLQGKTVGYNPVTQTIEEPEEEESLQKRAFQVGEEGDAVQILPHPGVHPQFHNMIGTLVEKKVDVFVCPEHGPEPVLLYLVDFGQGRLATFTEDEFRTAGSVN